MRHLTAILAALGLAITAAAAHAASPVTINNAANTSSACVVSSNLCVAIQSGSITPATSATTDKGGTITSGGAAQTAIASNTARKSWCIQNDPASTETLYVRVNGTASATSGVALSPGQQACNPPDLIDTAAVSVFAATTSHRWYGSEAQ